MRKSRPTCPNHRPFRRLTAPRLESLLDETRRLARIVDGLTLLAKADAGVVANTGPGIPFELLPRVFERFVRGESARHHAADGCGLGLVIVNWIGEARGGQISIGSEPGQRTTVSVRLPAKPVAG